MPLSIAINLQWIAVGVIKALEPGKRSIKFMLAKKFIEWITSLKAQKQIADFKLLGKQLFIPNADKE
jgi:tungstate transport system substrate-binding protein